MEKITKEMNIRDIMHKKPAAAPVMIEHGLHCVGCMAAQFESLAEGAQAHGMSEKEIDKMIDEINKLKG